MFAMADQAVLARCFHAANAGLQALITLTFLSVTLCSATLASTPTSINLAGDGSVLHHMVADRRSGRLYVGATNRLYQLTADQLSVEVTVTTGPRDDNPSCPPPPSTDCHDAQRTPTDAVSKALAVDSRSGRLISCTNLFQGHCDRHLLTNVTVTDPPVWSMVVPNDPDSPAIILVAPGPPNPASTDVLYVAATRSTVGLTAYRDIVPAVCARNKVDLGLVSDDILTKSRTDVEVQHRDTFRIRYVAGFSSAGFSYFVAEQRPSATSEPTAPARAHLARVCQNDRSFTSYVELPIECRAADEVFRTLSAVQLAHPASILARAVGFRSVTSSPPTDHEHVLVAVFSGGQSAAAAVGEVDSPTRSALCVYSMRDVRRAFTAAIQRCFRGEGNTGPDHLVQPKSCYNTNLDIADDYCGQHGINHPIKGADPVSRDAAITWSGTGVTSVAVTVSGNHTLAFVGTDDGFVKKVLIESAEKATEYGQLSIQPGTAVKQDMLVDRAGNHIYVLTNTKVFRVKVHNCSAFHGSCSECLKARDPFCGWCPLHRRCSTLEECTLGDVSITNSRWQSFDEGQCTSLLTVLPQMVPRHASSSSMIVLNVRNLQPSPAGFQCRFLDTTSGQTVHSTSVIQLERIDSSSTSLKCETPVAEQLPSFATQQDHIVMQLALSSEGYDVLTSNITFYDCAVHQSCSSCALSAFPCSWCVQLNKCVTVRQGCQSDVIIAGKQASRGSTHHQGPEQCPRIQGDSARSSPSIFVASGDKVSIKVHAHNLQNFQMSFKCLFDFNGGIEKHAWLLPAQNDQVFIECDPTTFELRNQSQFVDVPFSVTWGGTVRKYIDNPDKVQVRVYSCAQMASNCGRCRSADTDYNCGWCVSTKSCTVHGQCPPVDATDVSVGRSSWISRDQPCPDPVVTRFEPMSGPVEGGTSLTVIGENLGLSANDTSVTVAGVDCRITFYLSAVRLTCRTGRAADVSEGPVVVSISPSFAARSPGAFAYVKSDVTDLQPRLGPVSGGTRLTLTGSNLDAGSDCDVTLTNGSQSTSCRVASRTRTSMTCLTEAASTPFQADRLVVQIDNSRLAFTNFSFRFVADPEIMTIATEKGVYSGGSHVAVKGERLDTVQSPTIVVYVGDEAFTSPCNVVSSNEMQCVTPSLRRSSLNSTSLSAADPRQLCYGFILDGVTSLRNLSNPAAGRRTFLVVPDPLFEEFEDGTKKFFFLRNEYLTINGKNLKLALDETDIQVRIGNVECAVTSMSNTQLTCLPSEQHHNSPTTTLPVMVLIGNSSYYVGELEFATSVHRFLVSAPFLAGVAAAGGVLLTLVIIICAAYHHKSRESERVVRRMQCQMDGLEARVAKECKEAFAELQTDMTEIGGNISSPGGIPFHSYAGFCVRTFFPGVPANDHSVLGSFQYGTAQRNGMDRGLVLFNQLISNKIFMLLFIRTLEQRGDFIVREKVNVASLICIILMNRLEYLTDILKTLLSELIERSMEGRYHPKLLLRRTESVVEKMLANWFTILLHSFLKDCAGEPLYMMYLAVKHQVDRGPVDALSGDAKYSLSEDKLIRQQIDCRVLTIHVVDSETQYSQQTYTVKVLSCDTISQVKDKILDVIYRYVPFSLRPDGAELDLEWQTGVKDRVILQDDDVTTKTEGAFRRMNTIGYYRLPDGASVSLVPHQRSLYSINSNTSNNKSSLSAHKYDTLFASSLPLSRSTSSPNAFDISTVSGNGRLYHLVKPHDIDHHQKKGERNNNKMVSEVYLTRLLATKGALQQYVDNMFETIFSTMHRGCVMPVAIKYMFDFLDDQALQHGIVDSQVVHTWKSNSLPLRFWVNVIKNPEFVFDVHKSNAVDTCLSVIAQTFMDSCSVSEQKLGKDSSTSKLLYAKDIPKYKKWVERYYEDIQHMPAISEQDMNSMLCDESMLHQNEFNTSAALYELYQYTVKYNDDLMHNLEEDEFAQNHRLASRLSHVHAAMDSLV